MRWCEWRFAPLPLLLIIAVLFFEGLWWGVFGGLKLWGDYFNSLLGLGPLLGLKSDLANPFLHRLSLSNICLVLGSFSAALCSRNFKIQRAPMQEYVPGAIGGILMGLGATLAGGCTVGGFLTPLILFSPVGWTMAMGLFIGSFLGLKLLVWVSGNVTWGTRPVSVAANSLRNRGVDPLLGLLVFTAILAWASSWYFGDDLKTAKRAIVIVAGFALGFSLNRSRFCFAKVFMQPFLLCDSSAVKSMVLLLGLGMAVGAMLIQANRIDPLLAIPATFYLGSLCGGVIFGVGMMLGGGCASSSLWKLGEGHTKFWIVVPFFAWSGSLFMALANRWGLNSTQMNMNLLEVSKLGSQAYLPDAVGSWSIALLLNFTLLAMLYYFVRYSESSKRFTVL
ncbi:MAG: YeeE/YedE family protein [Spongiibacteraceae bacterium]|nr:YeeE/YedE family protein [Spongiibacteraceae bacterium]